MHPFANATPAAHRARFLFWFIASAIVMAGMWHVDAHIRTNQTPDGIVSFEFAARDADTTMHAIRAWTARQKQWVAFSLGFDYLFMPCYSCMLASACLWAAEAGRFAPRVGSALAWAMWVAAALDAAENYGLVVLMMPE